MNLTIEIFKWKLFPDRKNIFSKIQPQQIPQRTSLCRTKVCPLLSWLQNDHSNLEIHVICWNFGTDERFHKSSIKTWNNFPEIKLQNFFKKIHTSGALSAYPNTFQKQCSLLFHFRKHRLFYFKCNWQITCQQICVWLWYLRVCQI